MPLSVPSINALKIVAQDTRQGGTIAYAQYVRGAWNGTRFVEIDYDPDAPDQVDPRTRLRTLPKEVTVQVADTQTRAQVRQALLSALLTANPWFSQGSDHVLAPDGTVLPI